MSSDPSRGGSEFLTKEEFEQHARDLEVKLVKQDFRVTSLLRKARLRPDATSDDLEQKKKIRSAARKNLRRQFLHWVVVLSLGAIVASSASFVTLLLMAWSNSIAQDGVDTSQRVALGTLAQQRLDLFGDLERNASTSCVARKNSLDTLFLVTRNQWQEEDSPRGIRRFFPTIDREEYRLPDSVLQRFEAIHFDGCHLDEIVFPANSAIRSLSMENGSVKSLTLEGGSIASSWFLTMSGPVKLFLRDVTIETTRFTDVDLTGSTFSSVRFIGALNSVQFDRTDFTGVAICDVDFSAVGVLTQQDLDSMIITEDCAIPGPEFGVVLPPSLPNLKHPEHWRNSPTTK